MIERNIPSDSQETIDININDFSSLNDYVIAEMLSRFIKERFVYIQELKKWFYYSSKFWKEDKKGQIIQEMKQCLKQARFVVENITDDDKRQKVLKFLINSGNLSRINAAISLSQSEKGIPVSIDIYDRNPLLLNIDTGTVDLTTGKQKQHDKRDFLSKISNVSYDKNAKCPIFESFLYTIMNNNKELVTFIKKMMGYIITGLSSEQCIFILHGVGANGKSTFLEVLRMLLCDYAVNIPIDALMAKDSASVSNEIARLKGARLATTSEVELGKKLAENIVKSLSGNDMITARYLYCEPFEFRNQAKIVMATNHLPKISGTDEGIWRRIKTVPFEVSIPKEKRDKHLLEKLKTELPGILNFAIEGCLLWQKEGLGEPQAIINATQNYRISQDAIGGFLEECCLTKTTLSTNATTIYNAYVKWCDANGEYSLSQRVFGQRLSERGLNKKKSTGGLIVWENISLIKEDNEYPLEGVI